MKTKDTNDTEIEEKLNALQTIIQIWDYVMYATMFLGALSIMGESGGWRPYAIFLIMFVVLGLYILFQIKEQKLKDRIPDLDQDDIQ